MKNICYTIVFILAACGHRTGSKALAGIQTLPAFTLISPDSTHIVKSETIQKGRASVFFYFDPECDHCQKETTGILAHQGDFKAVQFYFLSNSTAKEIDSFRKYYRLDRLPNVFVGKDYAFSFYNVFLPSSIPYMAVYDADKKLRKIYNGEADIPSLIQNTRN